MNADQERLKDILAAAHVIREVAQQGEGDFMHSNILQGAVLYNFLIIGEAVAHISDDMKQAHPEVKWRDIRSFRNLLIHGYMYTNLRIVWGIVQSDLEQLREQVEAILSEIGEEQHEY